MDLDERQDESLKDHTENSRSNQDKNWNNPEEENLDREDELGNSRTDPKKSRKQNTFFY